MITRLDSVTLTWSKAGELVSGRRGHNAIEVNGEILIVRGYHGVPTIPTERCKNVGGNMRCTQQNPNLNEYSTYPELFAVPNKFCN